MLVSLSVSENNKRLTHARVAAGTRLQETRKHSYSAPLTNQCCNKLIVSCSRVSHAHGMCSVVCAGLSSLLQDILTLSAPLTANLHELLESVKQLGNQVLSPTAASSQQLLPELAGAKGSGGVGMSLLALGLATAPLLCQCDMFTVPSQMQLQPRITKLLHQALHSCSG